MGTFDPISYTTRTPSVLFLGGGSTLYYPSGEGTTTINAFRAYFTLNGIVAGDSTPPEGGTGFVKGFVLNFDEDDEADAIGSIQNSNFKDDGEMVNGKSSNGKWFDLSGRKMVNGKSSNGKLPKGIYIVNGKKVLIK